MWCVLAGFILFGIALSILGTDNILFCLYCLAGIVIYGIYLVIDTQLIAGGKKVELSYDDYILGALMLYIDIIGLFIYILSLFGRSRNWFNKITKFIKNEINFWRVLRAPIARGLIKKQYQPYKTGRSVHLWKHCIDA